MRTLLLDLGYAARMLRKNLGLTAVAVLTLGIGIGANTVIFSSVNAMLLKAVSFPEVERLVMIWDREPSRGVERGAVSAADFLEWTQASRSFASLAAYSWWQVNLSAVGVPEHVGAAVVSPSFFRTLQVSPALGRGFLEEEGVRGRDQVVVLSHSLWQRRFGGDPGLVGRRVRLDRRDYTVVGVMPADFEFPMSPALWVPLSLGPERTTDHTRYLTVIGRLGQNVSQARAGQEMEAIAARIARHSPETNAGHTVRVMPMREGAVDEFTPRFIVLLMGAVGFVLLIACANVAGLALAKGAARRKEIAIRMALGAERSHLIRQLLTESVLLGALGGLLGLLIAVWGVDASKQSIPVDVRRFIPGWRFMEVDGLVLLFNTALSLATGLVFGLAPALTASRVGLTDALKEGGRTSGSDLGQRTRRLLVVAEVALALVLLVGSVILVQGFRSIAEPQQDLDSRHVLTLRLALADTKDAPGSASSADDVRAFYRNVLDRVGGVPGVMAVGLTSQLPWNGGRGGVAVRVEGAEVARESERPRSALRVVSPGYFSALATPLREGRDFDARDQAHTTPVAIVNDALARSIARGRSPIGMRLRLEGFRSDTSLVVVGMVGDFERSLFDKGPVPTTYVTYLQRPAHSVRLAIRTATEPAAVLPAVRAAIAAVDPEQAAFEAKSLRKLLDDQISGIRFSARMMAMLGLAALLLAAIGVYGLVAHGVALRTREFGVRIAVGARPRDVLGLVVWQGAKLALQGLAIGLPAAWGVSEIMRHTFVGIVPSGSPGYAAIVGLLFVVVIAASWLPALAATRVDPMTALKAE